MMQQVALERPANVDAQTGRAPTSGRRGAFVWVALISDRLRNKQMRTKRSYREHLDENFLADLCWVMRFVCRCWSHFMRLLFALRHQPPSRHRVGLLQTSARNHSTCAPNKALIEREPSRSIAMRFWLPVHSHTKRHNSSAPTRSVCLLFLLPDVHREGSVYQM